MHTITRLTDAGLNVSSAPAWWRTSRTPPKLFVVPDNDWGWLVVMRGSWGRITRAYWGRFATEPLAQRAKRAIELMVKLPHEGFAICADCDKLVWHEQRPKRVKASECCSCRG